jgi:hypothetical protein
LRSFATFAVNRVRLDEQQKVRAALGKLTDVLAGIARTADEKNRERCPYKTVDSVCTYSGGCQNQNRIASHFALRTAHSVIDCTGDHLIEWSPAPEAQSPEPSR